MSEPEFLKHGELDPRRGMEQLASMSFLLDRAFRIPGTQWRFGLDGFIGLIPGLGDIVGSLIGAYSLWIAQRIGAPGAVQARMVANLALDGVLGLVPIAGDLFDFVYKANTRNHALLVSWLQSPRQTHRSSWAILTAAALIMLALLGGSAWLLISSVKWLVALLP